jgi:putative toxin-antitoxin system antitoxin component (TIGR02293 family)
MTKTVEHPLNAPTRSAARSSIWQLILGQNDAPKSARTQSVERSLAGFKLGNDQAYRILKTGVTSKTLAPVGDFLGLSKSLIASYLELDRSTVSRMAAKNQILPTHAAENVLRLLELDAIAAETFETESDASEWLRRPHPMLDGETPLAAAKTSFGSQRVKDMLLAIKYGGVV